jgi:hypothetical protein
MEAKGIMKNAFHLALISFVPIRSGLQDDRWWKSRASQAIDIFSPGISKKP